MKTIKMLLLSAVLLLCCCAFGQTADMSHRLYYLSVGSLPTSLRTDNLTNNAGLRGADITQAVNILGTFNSQFNNVVSKYNSTPRTADNTALFNSLQSQLNAVTATAQASLTKALTSEGLEALEASVASLNVDTAGNAPQIAHMHNMLTMGIKPQVGNPNCSVMSGGYSVVKTQTVTVLSVAPMHVTANINWHLTGIVNGVGSGCNSIQHIATVNMLIGPHTATESETGPSNSYFDVQASVTLDSVADSCATSGCTTTSNADVFCTFLQNNMYYNSDNGTKVEIAVTKVLYIGPTTGCHSGASGTEWCEYRVGNFCTPATTPPDLNLDFQNINDLYSTPPPNGWWAAGLCFGTPGLWVCSYGGAYRLFGAQTEGNCTKN